MASVANRSSLLDSSQDADQAMISWFDHFKDHFNATERFPAPFVGFKGMANTYPYNDEGFMNPSSPTAPKPANEHRVFIVGDSTMCSGPSVPDHAQALIANSGRHNVRIYNYSVLSSRASQMLALIFNELLDLEPDQIIVVTGGAEAYIPHTYDPRPNYPFNHFIVEELYARFFSLSDSADMNEQFTRGDIYRALGKRLEQLRTSVGIDQSEKWEETNASAFYKIVDRMEKLATAYDTHISLLLQPMLAEKAEWLGDESTFLKPETAEYFRRQYSRFRSDLFPHGASRVQRTANFELRDFSRIFDELPAPVFRDFIHYNPSGVPFMGLKVAEIIAENFDQHART
jgi:hypothetical protein